MINIIKIASPYIDDTEIDAVAKVLRSGNLSQGKITKSFEDKFAKYCNIKYAVAVNSGTAALHSALNALGINAQDEVITSPLTFVATANAVLMQGAKVEFCDIDEETFNIDPGKVTEKITKNTKAIIPVDLYGHMYDVPKINSIAKKNNLKVIEDAAQAVGSEYKGRRAGSVADVSCFSLYATKNLTSGAGGIITTNNKKVAETIKLFRNHGQEDGKLYYYKGLGYNYTMSNIIASIAKKQLERLDRLIATRRRNAHILTKYLKNIKGLTTPKESSFYKDSYHQYTIRILKEYKITRKKFMEYLEKHNIQTRIYYPKPLHLYPHFQKLGYKKGDFPVAEALSQEIVSLPVHPLVSKDEINYIVKTIRSIV